MAEVLSTGNQPQRTCIGCRERAAKSELLRVVAGSDAEGRPALRPDPDGRAPGRGAHLHPTTECYELAVRRKAFGRALRVQAGSVPGGLDSTAVGEFVAARARQHHQHDPHDQHVTEDRQEGWSSSS